MVLPTALSDLPQSRLLTVFPPGMAAGATHEVVVTGTDLEEPLELVISDPRIRAERHPSKPRTFLVAVPPDREAGWVDIRCSGRFGVSNPRAMAIGPGPELILNPTNTTSATAVALQSGIAISGRLPSNRVLWFRVMAARGERWIARVQAREMDSRLEPALRVFDGADREIGRARQGMLDWTASESGEFRVQLRDVTYRGGEDFHFRIEAGTGPHLDAAMPMVLRAGETNRVTLFGRNLAGGRRSPFGGWDGKPLDQVTVDIVAPAIGDTLSLPVEMLRRPAAALLAGESMSWSLAGTNGRSNPLLFSLTTQPVAMADDSQAPLGPSLPGIVPPVEFCGWFPRRGEISGVTFEARKGDVYWIELWSERLGFPCDPAGLVQRGRKTRGERGEALYADVQEFGDNEVNPGGVEFNTASRDPVGRLEIPEDGTYRVLIRDLFHTGSDTPRFPYRLSIRRETPSFALVVLPMQPIRANDNDRAVHPAAAFLRRGGTELLRVLAFRRDGFSGDIDLGADELGGGIAAGVSRIPSGQSVGFLPLRAGTNAGGMSRPVIWGRGTVATRSIERRAFAAVAGPASDSNEQAVPSRLVRESLVSASAVEWSPVTLEVPPGRVFEVEPGGKLTLPLGITRRGEFNGEFKLKLSGRAELDKTKEVSVPDQATHITVEISLADATLPAGTHQFWLQGQIAGKYRNNPEALVEAEAALKAAEQVLAAATGADKAALEERRMAAEQVRKSAEERSKPRDVTVRIYSPPIEVRIIPAPTTEAKP